MINAHDFKTRKAKHRRKNFFVLLEVLLKVLCRFFSAHNFGGNLKWKKRNKNFLIDRFSSLFGAGKHEKQNNFVLDVYFGGLIFVFWNFVIIALNFQCSFYVPYSTNCLKNFSFEFCVENIVCEKINNCWKNLVLLSSLII